MSTALRSSLLTDAGFAHGFFTRKVAPDWEQACTDLGVPREKLFLLSQVHGVRAAILDGDEDHLALRKVDGDITVSAAPGVACGTRVADCAPVLLANPRTGAVAAVHSGWRGTVLRAVEVGVRAVSDRGGPSSLVAAIGPLIERCCFEVGEDVALELAASSPLGEAVIDRSRPRPHVDLRRVLAAQLKALGVVAVEQVGGCTRCDFERFHSFRRDGTASGRLLAAIVARPPGHFPG
jgi:YfiH family protein